MRSYLGNIGVVVVITVGVMSLFAGAGAHRRQGDVNAECVSNIGKVATGLAEYVQDYDETFPIATTGAQLENAILPYTHDVGVFTCPATGLLYKPDAKISGQPMAAITGDYGTIRVVMDAKKHPDGLLTVAFLDGHVTHGGVDQADPNTECASNAKRLTLGLMMYAQDYDGYLPPMQSPTKFQNATYPYIRSHRLFRCPATGLHYVPNAALSGTSISSYSDPSTVEVLHDAQPHSDGLSTYSYLDGHVVQK
ncbi:MAG TPA: hypothetical protein VFA07_01340 [Chthonomonadaceae bacterium]|nr:hypothetical protein [Chthonomonadaceae bacterium]